MGDKSKEHLRPTLSLFDATTISIGAIIGGGIYVVTGIVAGLAGPALVISMIIAGLIALSTALSFVELTRWMPKEGSVYEFAYQLISPFAGFLTGWMWIVSNTFVGAAVSLGFAYYLRVMFPSVDYRLIAAAVCLIFTALNLVGSKQSAKLNDLLVVAKVSILIIFCVAGFFYMKSSNFVPFIPSQLGVLYGAFFIFFAYGGFARIAVVAEEVKDTRRNVPRAIVLSLIISTALYISVGVVAVGLVGSEDLSKSNSPLSDAIGVIGSPMLVHIISLGGMLATATVLLTAILGVSRMAFAMARRNDMPSLFSRLSSGHGTPSWSILAFGITMALLAVFVDLAGVIAVSNFALLFYYAIANVSDLKLKDDYRIYPRLIPTLGLVTCLVLLMFVQLSVLLMGFVCLLAGAVYYMMKKRFDAGEKKCSTVTYT
ncbi:MAG: APC family permease [Nitrososphaeria archaeon]